MSTVAAAPVDQVVDTDRFPLAAPGSADWKVAVARARQELQALGCCVLSGFIRSSSVDALRRECSSVAPLAYDDVETVNVYNTPADSALPTGHPARAVMERGNAFVARDQIPDGFVIHRLYTSPDLLHFIASCFELPEVHPLADPLAGLCLNVLTDGKSHPWHFDTNELAVSLLTQEPEAGGTFEYCPAIRSAQAENFDDVAAVLAGGGGARVRCLCPRPGDLQLFRGRHTLHRVTAVQGGTDRHSAIFGYSARPGVVGTVARTQQLFGRVLPEHLTAAGRAAKVDQLLD